jgi:hypothetical protein
LPSPLPDHEGLEAMVAEGENISDNNDNDMLLAASDHDDRVGALGARARTPPSRLNATELAVMLISSKYNLPRGAVDALNRLVRAEWFRKEDMRASTALDRHRNNALPLLPVYSVPVAVKAAKDQKKKVVGGYTRNDPTKDFCHLSLLDVVKRCLTTPGAIQQMQPIATVGGGAEIWSGAAARSSPLFAPSHIRTPRGVFTLGGLAIVRMDTPPEKLKRRTRQSRPVIEVTARITSIFAMTDESGKSKTACSFRRYLHPSHSKVTSPCELGEVVLDNVDFLVTDMDRLCKPLESLAPNFRDKGLDWDGTVRSLGYVTVCHVALFSYSH